MISLSDFLGMPVEKLAETTRSFGGQVVVFPFNGTRRWFLFEHVDQAANMTMDAYNDLAGKRYIELFKMLFDHGIDTVLAPIFGGDIMERGAEYMDSIGAAMSRLAENPDFTSFYNEYDVRVHFYGDYRKKFRAGDYAQLIDSFDKITTETAGHQKKRLFYGVFAGDATEAVADISVSYYKENSEAPDRRQVIEKYYGEYIERANIFIGFEKFTVFDYPLLNAGDESVYFTVAPSLFMTELQLRRILYDHLFLRPMEEPDYLEMSKDVFSEMKRFYTDHLETTFGVGEVHNGIWYAKGE